MILVSLISHEERDTELKSTVCMYEQVCGGRAQIPGGRSQHPSHTLPTPVQTG